MMDPRYELIEKTEEVRKKTRVAALKAKITPVPKSVIRELKRISRMYPYATVVWSVSQDKHIIIPGHLEPKFKPLNCRCSISKIKEGKE